eukprot:6438940-Amphidinium_carterae.1
MPRKSCIRHLSRGRITWFRAMAILNVSLAEARRHEVKVANTHELSLSGYASTGSASNTATLRLICSSRQWREVDPKVVPNYGNSPASAAEAAEMLTTALSTAVAEQC